MLVNPKIAEIGPYDEGFKKMLRDELHITEEEFRETFRIHEIEPGAFQIHGFNFEHRFADPKAWDEWPRLMDHQYPAFGVCDSPIQFFEHELGQFIRESARFFSVSFTEVQKCYEPSEGGWRWHKWGPYIGNQNAPTTEYLYDEPEVEVIYCYAIYERVREEE